MDPLLDHATEREKVGPAVAESPVKYAESGGRTNHTGFKYGFLMVGSLLAGLAFALGHHFFYASFNHELVSQNISQDWILRIGTGLAFLVKLLFVVATGIAYTQRQWLTIGSRPFKIRQIDAMTGVLGNLLHFLHTTVWFRHPILLTLAGLTWLIPLSAVVTPGTITVVLATSSDIQSARVPQLLFDMSKWAVYQVASGQTYRQPQTDVLRLGNAAAYTHQIIPLQAPATNTSWSTSFYAPAVQCLPANASVLNAMNQSIAAGNMNTGNGNSFVAFVPGLGESATNPGDSILNGTGATSFDTGDVIYTSLDVVSADAARLFVMPNSSAYDPASATAHYNWQDTLECQLHNASYHVDFDYHYPQQSATIRSLDILEPVAAVYSVSDVMDQDYFNGQISTNNSRVAYQTVMDALGKLIVGVSVSTRYGGTSDVQTSWQLLGINWTTQATAKAGVEQLFQNMTLSMLGANSLLQNATQATNTSVMFTRLNTVYEYKPQDLYIAYGLALLCATLCVLVGLHAIWANGCSYQNNFSTFVRTTRDPALQDLIDPNDKGADPLPAHIAEQKVMLHYHGSTNFEMTRSGTTATI